MISIFAPNWFTRFDILIEIFSFLVLLTFFTISIRNYKLTKNKKLLTLGIGFVLIAMAEISTILTKFVVYYKTTVFQAIGNIIITYNVFQRSDLPYDIGSFLYKLLTLAGLYIIYRLPLKNKNTSDAILAILFIIISSLAGLTFYYIFHIVVLVMLLLIVNNYLKVYKKNKSCNTKLLIIAFTIFAVAHAFFIVSMIKSGYVTGQILQLFSYLIFLLLIIKINKNEGPKQK
jgi:hypothetical protein